jgi:signal peptidase I
MSTDKKPKTFLQKLWYFIWEDDSPLSWIVNIIIAFVLIKFVIYPGVGLILGTTHPVVAVVSGSMEHKITMDERGLNICGRYVDNQQSVTLDYFWETCGDFYAPFGITKEQFTKFSFRNGFNTGDIIVLFGTKPENIKIGDVIVFKANQPDPIIHRVVKKWEDGGYHFQTKGDHNGVSIPYPVNELEISQSRVIGKAVFKIPYLGYIKIWFVNLLKVIGLGNTVGKLF